MMDQIIHYMIRAGKKIQKCNYLGRHWIGQRVVNESMQRCVRIDRRGLGDVGSTSERNCEMK